MIGHPVANGRADSGIIHTAFVAALPIHRQAQIHVMDPYCLARLVAPRRRYHGSFPGDPLTTSNPAARLLVINPIFDIYSAESFTVPKPRFPPRSCALTPKRTCKPRKNGKKQ